MSIHQLANHLQSAGRGEDKVLVHMTPGEVNGLQALAMAHGGSLTINPQTGLPEAGFLKAILPMVAGFFLGPAGLGIAKTALGAAAMVGGATGIATGSLSKGLMAGLGAYGGFGLAESLAGAGAAANAAKAGVSTLDDVAAAKAAQLSGTGGIPNKLSDALGATTNTGASGVSQVSNINQPLAKPFASGFQNAGDVMRGGLATPPQVQAATDVVLQSPNQLVVQSGTDAAAKAAQLKGTGGIPNKLSDALGATKAAPVTNWSNVKAGFNDVTSSGTKAWEFVKQNPMPFVGAGLGLLSDMSGSGSSSASGAKKQPGTIRPYEYSVAQNQSAYAPSDSTAERTYFTEPRFTAGTPYAAKEGGIMGYAVGGPVEQMSAQNAVGNNTMYPQAQLQTDMYSNPMVQRPMPTNVIHSGVDAPVDRYSGEIRMASGGAAASKTTPSTDTKYSYNPDTMQYTQTTAAAPASNAFTGNPFVDGMVGLFGVGPYAMGNMGLNGSYMGVPYSKLFGQQASQQPVTKTETLGGVAAPYVPRNQEVIAQTPAPSVSIPAYQAPEQQLGLNGFYNMMGDQLAMKGAQMQAQGQGYAVGGGISDLGGYSDGGRLLRGPGDGVSDSIPASIGDRQPARLADGEFVVPARIVSEIGNGSTEAGAKKLYAMMDRVQHARKKTVGKNQVAKNTKAEKLLPA